jgi:hypothetical protein
MIDGHCIYKLIRSGLYAFENSQSDLSETQKKQEHTYVNLVDTLLKSKDFYFSYSFDITNSLNRQHAKRNDTSPLYLKVDKRFFWNEKLMDEFIKLNLSEWILPIMRGIIQVFMVIMQQRTFDYILISRRSKFRAGTRYETRGVDSNGNVANYIETEQLLHIDGHKLSYIQTRGSIPLVWEQSGRKYTPIPKINPDKELNIKLFQAHFREQFRLYQGQVVVSLLDQKGIELELAQAFDNHLMNYTDDLSKLTFRAFDFHAECKGNNYDNVSFLIQGLQEVLNKQGFFHLKSNGEVSATQSSVVRTNCLDCLDRTNLVQSFFGRYMLAQQLKEFDITYNPKDSILEKILKEAWANNGDAISMQYAGTGALKSDFTRTGKSTTKGNLKDGVNSLSRYYINNFRDRLRQIGIDVFLGNYSLNNHEESDNDLLDQNGILNEDQMRAIDACLTFLGEELEKKEAEEGKTEQIINAWIVTSINKMSKEQERVLVLTDNGLYRFKYNFKGKKIIHFKRNYFNEISFILKGPFKSSSKKFGLEIALNIDKPFYPMYSALDFSRESVNKIIESIKDALDGYRVLTGGTSQPIPIIETELSRKKNATSTMRRSIEEAANQARASGENKKKLTQ